MINIKAVKHQLELMEQNKKARLDIAVSKLMNELKIKGAYEREKINKFADKVRKIERNE
jgi:hypothetical protein